MKVSMLEDISRYSSNTQKILKDCKAFVDGGHFIYSSGRHGDFYINKDALYMHPKKLDDVSYMLTQLAFSSFNIPFDVVLAPTMGGILLGQAIAYNASIETNSNVFFAYSERSQKNTNHRVIRRRYDRIIKGNNVLLVDDIVTTGMTMVGMAKAVLRMGGNVIGGISICNRGNIRNIKFYPDNTSEAFDLHIVPLLELDLRTFSSEDCPFCKSGRPIDPRLGEGTGYFLDDDIGRVSK